jgi:hypothetical protein
MYHNIQFNSGFTVDLEVSPKQRLEQLLIGEGMRVQVSIQPSVVETPDGPVEVADLYFEDGTVTRQVPYARFRFVE